MALLLKLIAGNFSASKKSPERRWPSLRSSLVVMPFTSAVISKSAFSGRSGSSCSLPVSLPSCPRTVLTTMCFTEKLTCECDGSMYQNMCWFSSTPACADDLVDATINWLRTQSIPTKRKRRLRQAEEAGWESFLRAYAATSHALERLADSRGGLPLGEHFLLVQIARGPEAGIRPTDLAARSLLTKSGVTRAIDRLERDGLVARNACPTDGRAFHIVLTPRGRHLLK